MNEQSFNQNKHNAIKQMQEMKARSLYKEAPITKHEEAEPPKPQPQTAKNVPSALNFPFLENLKKDGDLTLILGILLLLLSEKADKRLLFALIYILL